MLRSFDSWVLNISNSYACDRVFAYLYVFVPIVCTIVAVATLFN